MVRALRWRDGTIESIRPHRRDGVCKYEQIYARGECDWCKALDHHERRVDEHGASIIEITWRLHSAEASPARRIA